MRKKKKKLTELLIEDIGDSECNRFHEAARGFYETAYIYCKKWLPLDNPFLEHCHFINFEDRNKRTFDGIIEIITLMKNLYVLVLEKPIQLSLLEEEFLNYQSMSEKDLKYESPAYDAVT